MVTKFYIIYDSEKFDRESIGDFSSLFWGIDLYFYKNNDKTIYKHLSPNNLGKTLIVQVGDFNPINFKNIDDSKGVKYNSVIILASTNENIDRFIEKNYQECDTMVLYNDFYTICNMRLEPYISHFITRLYYTLDVDIIEHQPIEIDPNQLDL